MSECAKCHGTCKVTCPKCGGKKEVKCEECNGTGRHECHSCSGSGKERCSRCKGSGNEISICPVCNHGKVERSRWINCRHCHGTGRKYASPYSCEYCDGQGQVKETYEIECPHCKGAYRQKVGSCKKCGGTGRQTCSSCGGEKIVQCGECSGKGIHDCHNCKGAGRVKCPDCEKREREAKERQERKEREERDRRIAAREKKEAAEKAAKERKEMAQGCGCLLALIAIVSFLVWWWMEGFTMAGLSSIGAQLKDAVGGKPSVAFGPLAKIVGVIVALLVALALIKGKKGEESTSDKKRWKFVVLGLLFGFLGIHLAYAKRWFLFLLLWAGMIIGGTASDRNAAARSVAETEDAQVEQQSAAKQNGTGNTLENVGFAIWGFLWFGGALFIKKDGKGNRM